MQMRRCASLTNRWQKKKCNEERPQCDRCSERGLKCEYEPVKPRKRRRTSFAGSALSHETESSAFYNGRWAGRFYETDENDNDDINKWEKGSQFHYPESDASIEWDGPYGYGNDVEEIIRTEPLDPGPSSAIIRSRSQYPDLAMIAPSPVASPLLEFCSPVFQEFTEKRSRRGLVDHFCNVLSHLIVFKEDTGNPFRQLVLPLSHGCSPVMNAIFALSSAHLEYKGIENEEKSLDFHNKALQGLAQLIEQNDPANREEVLGAIMLLVYYEVVRFGDSTRTHSLMRDSLSNEVTRISSTGISKVP